MKDKMHEIELFKEDISNEYVRTKLIDKIIEIQPTKTDGKFVQIAIRHLIENEWFKLEGLINSFGFLGKPISLGEFNFLIKNIINMGDIVRLDCNKMGDLFKEINEFNSDTASIIMHINFFYDTFLPFAEKSINYEREGVIKYNNIRIFLANEASLDKNKIILIKKECGVWWYKKNKENKLADSLFIDVLSNDLKFDVIIKSVNKLEISHPEDIKLIDMRLAKNHGFLE